MKVTLLQECFAYSGKYPRNELSFWWPHLGSDGYTHQRGANWKKKEQVTGIEDMKAGTESNTYLC